jgi:hypothetical protein
MADDMRGITVLIATCNRAAMLSQTLEAFTCVDQTGIDYNICDHTFVEGGVRIGQRVTLKCGFYLGTGW